MWSHHSVPGPTGETTALHLASNILLAGYVYSLEKNSGRCLCYLLLFLCCMHMGVCCVCVCVCTCTYYLHHFKDTFSMSFTSSFLLKSFLKTCFCLFDNAFSPLFLFPFKIFCICGFFLCFLVVRLCLA